MVRVALVVSFALFTTALAAPTLLDTREPTFGETVSNAWHKVESGASAVLDGASNAVALAQQAKDVSDAASALHADFKASRASKAASKAAAGTGTGTKASTPRKASGGSSKGRAGGKKRDVELGMMELVAM